MFRKFAAKILFPDLSVCGIVRAGCGMRKSHVLPHLFCPKTEILKGIDVMRLLSDIYYSSFYLDVCSGEYQVIRPPLADFFDPERGILTRSLRR